jgi:hypothetical protein
MKEWMLFTRTDKHNFNNCAIHPDIHFREEVGEKKDTFIYVMTSCYALKGAQTCLFPSDIEVVVYIPLDVILLEVHCKYTAYSNDDR